LTVTDAQATYASGLHEKLRNAGVRVQKDLRNEKLGFKIREAQLQKIPYMLIIGDKELETGTVTPRFRDGKNLEPMTVEQFISFIAQESADFH
jgi:threonyl-tRNA synthetase